VIRVVLLWVYDHYYDFECSPEMADFLDDFARCLHKEGKEGQLELLDLARSTRSHSRTVKLCRSRRSESWGFTLLPRLHGLMDVGAVPVYIKSVEEKCQAAQLGLRQGDQVCDTVSITSLDISTSFTYNIHEDIN